MRLLLIVDDNEDMRDTLSDIFGLAGFTTMTARNGQEALQCLKHSKGIHVVVLDLDMPVMNGHQFLDAKAHQVELRHIPVVIFSSETDRNRYLGEAGVAAVCAKGGAMTELVDAVNKVSRRINQD